MGFLWRDFLGQRVRLPITLLVPCFLHQSTYTWLPLTYDSSALFPATAHNSTHPYCFAWAWQKVSTLRCLLLIHTRISFPSPSGLAPETVQVTLASAAIHRMGRGMHSALSIQLSWPNTWLPQFSRLFKFCMPAQKLLKNHQAPSEQVTTMTEVLPLDKKAGVVTFTIESAGHEYQLSSLTPMPQCMKTNTAFQGISMFPFSCSQLSKCVHWTTSLAQWN